MRCREEAHHTGGVSVLVVSSVRKQRLTFFGGTACDVYVWQRQERVCSADLKGVALCEAREREREKERERKRVVWG